jgi:hypothetical protein
MTNPFSLRVNAILALLAQGQYIAPMMITAEDRVNSAVMSLIAQHMSQENLLHVVADLGPEMVRVVVMSADPISAIRICLTLPDYATLIRERSICDQIVPAFQEFLAESGDHRVDSEDDLKVMFQRLREFCPDMAALVLTFAPPGIALQECGD